jgi:hypothetical protein
MSKLIEHVKEVAREDVRLYFAPFRGAIEAIRKELSRSRQEYKSLRPEKRNRRADSTP